MVTRDWVAFWSADRANESSSAAIVVASDPMAVGVYKDFAEAGLSIPKDMSVVSFDDIEMAQFMTPALSSVKMKAEEMGQMSVN